MLRTALGCLVFATLVSPVSAEPTTNTQHNGQLPQTQENPYGKRRLLLLDGPEMPELPPVKEPLSGSVIYLNRCEQGCNLRTGASDMTTEPITSDFAPGNISIAPASDLTEEEWDGVVQCVKEVYSPFNVTITDQEPGPEVPVYSGIIAAGNSQAKMATAFGVGPDVGGFGSASCNPNPRGVAFAFADNDNVNAFAFEVSGNTSTQARILGLCWIIAQETAHTFGLDHEFEYLDDKTSACNDPMTYRFDCGGQKFFRNRLAACGEFVEMGTRPCKCGANQNSHLRLQTLFGAGTSLIPAPTVSITVPAASSTAANSLGNQVNASAGSERGVNRVELHVNGYKWAQLPGAPFGRNGQLNPSNYTITIPADLPDSIVDIQVKAFDDLELVGESQVLTVVKGAAGGCQTADTCAEGQKCEAGKCFWDPPAGEIGDACSFPQFCKTGICSDAFFQGDAICTQSCVVGLADVCPAGLECIEAGNDAICFPASDKGGCCSSSNDTPWAPFMLGFTVLGFIVIRRKK